MGFLKFIKSLFIQENTEDSMKKYLIVGLGNIGDKYDNTRHNIGFDILDFLANKQKVVFESAKLGAVTKFRHKGRLFILLKPATYMNLSGKAVRYWQTKEKIALENTLVICDDLSLPLGALRLKSKGGAGGHNGLQNIQDMLGTAQYPRLRFGIGNDFSRGKQVDFVLGKWKDEEREKLTPRIEKAAQAILSFGTAGLNNTMNGFNGSPET
jgi:PTH1 family peptidyl-tRNA hydrolase